MEITNDSPNANDAAYKLLTTRDVVGSYAGSKKNQDSFNFTFNFNAPILNGDDATLTYDHRARSVMLDTDEVVKMLESWLAEEVTEAGEENWRKLEKALDENRLSFDEIR